MSINDTSRDIARLLRHTTLTQSEIARKLGVNRQRVLQVRKYIDKNPYEGFDCAKLKVRIEAKNWSIREMARRLRVHPSQVSRWVRGEQDPWPNMWKRICVALGCRVQDLEKDGV